MSEQVPDDGLRELEDDHDLLTYNEAGARLVEEIRRLEQLLSDLEQRSAAGEPGLEQAVEATRARAASLRAAADRNGRLAEHDTGASGFLSYRAPRY